MNAQHAPTPKIAIENLTKSARGMISGDLCVEDSGWNGERYLAELKDVHPDFAAFIVRACNNHDALVAALQSAAESIEQLVRLNRIPANNKGLRDARAALAAAGETI